MRRQRRARAASEINVSGIKNLSARIHREGGRGFFARGRVGGFARRGFFTGRFFGFLTDMARYGRYSIVTCGVRLGTFTRGVVMISRLVGEVVEIEGDVVVIDVQGVGYEVLCTSSLLLRTSLGSKVTVTVYTDVKEDSIRLFGFDSVAERHVFLLLNRVSGMGPRSSLDVVSNVAIRDLLRAIGSGDVKALMSIKGVGKKKAERIVVELKDLVANMAGERAESLRAMVTVEKGPGDRASGLSTDAVSALEVLGFGRKDAESAVSQALAAQVSFEAVGDLVREALRFV